jgi:hypothetical protein
MRNLICSVFNVFGEFKFTPTYLELDHTDFLRLVWFGFMVFNATFNNISVISVRSVLLMEKTGVPGENLLPCASQ